MIGSSHLHQIVAGWIIGIIPILSFGLKPPAEHFKPGVSTILSRAAMNEIQDKSSLKQAKTVDFNQVTSGSTDATQISMLSISYFLTTNCTSSALGSYTTPSAGSPPTFPIAINRPFGLVQTSTWDIGVHASIADMTSVNSIAITFYSTTNNTPQSNFSNSSFVCIPVVCASGSCTSSSSTQAFTLKNIAAIGDPADGGVIACMDPTINPPTNAGYLIATTSDDSAGIVWSASSSLTNALSTTDGSNIGSPENGNTYLIVNALGAGAYAASLCANYSTSGGYNTGWFLPAQSQLNCLYTNRNTINAFTQSNYWSSTEADSSNAYQEDNSGHISTAAKTSSYAVRCVSSFTPTTQATLSPSLSPLALSVNNPSLNAALIGNPRQITFQNIGLTSATNVSVSSSGLPSGTTISSTTCTGNLASGSSCTVTITPGPTTTSNCTTGTAPTNGSVTVSADNAMDSSANVVVLSYGCIYEGGYIYSIDDSTVDTGSIGGNVLATTDQVPRSPGIIWSSNGNGSSFADVSFVAILGIDDASTTGLASPNTPLYPNDSTPVACQGNTDGACNSTNILYFYNQWLTAAYPGSYTTGTTPLSDYAAGICTMTINNFSDWYLPSICEFGYYVQESGSINTGCGTLASPTIQNIQSNLVNTSILPLSGEYWSSTEYSGTPQYISWGQIFPGGGQSPDGKESMLGVRCVRSF